MEQLRLDFTYYPVKNAMLFEVESDKRMEIPFGHGYVKSDFTNFLNYIVALSFNKNNLIPSLGGLQVLYRFEKYFPEVEKNIIKGIMRINNKGTFEEGLVGKVMGSINPTSVLIGTKSEKRKKQLSIYFLDSYVKI